MNRLEGPTGTVYNSSAKSLPTASPTEFSIFPEFIGLFAEPIGSTQHPLPTLIFSGSFCSHPVLPCPNPKTTSRIIRSTKHTLLLKHHRHHHLKRQIVRWRNTPRNAQDAEFPSIAKYECSLFHTLMIIQTKNDYKFGQAKKSLIVCEWIYKR